MSQELATLQALAQVVIGAVLALILATGIASLLVARFRAFVLRRVIGGVARAITEESGAARTEREERTRRRREVLEAVGVLEEGISLGSGSYDGHIKMSQAASVLELYGPRELTTTGLLRRVIAAGDKHIQGVPLQQQREIMSEVTRIVRAWADTEK